jgi:hypothetical protein
MVGHRGGWIQEGGKPVSVEKLRRVRLRVGLATKSPLSIGVSLPASSSPQAYQGSYTPTRHPTFRPSDLRNSRFDNPSLPRLSFFSPYSSPAKVPSTYDNRTYFWHLQPPAYSLPPACLSSNSNPANPLVSRRLSTSFGPTQTGRTSRPR